MLCRYLGRSSFTGYGEGLIFIHEKLNEVEMKAYFDLLYQAGAKNVVYADESVQGIPEGTAHGLPQIFSGGTGRELQAVGIGRRI